MPKLLVVLHQDPQQCRGLPINLKFISKLIPPVFVLVLSCWFRKRFLFDFWPHWGWGCCKAVFDSSKEASWCTECNAKTPAAYKVWFLKKSRITSKNIHFLPKLPKMVIFGGVSRFFETPYFVKSWGFLRCIQWIKILLLSYQKPI